MMNVFEGISFPVTGGGDDSGRRGDDSGDLRELAGETGSSLKTEHRVCAGG